MKKKLYIPWWVLVLARWLVYGGLFALTSVLSLETAPPELTVLLSRIGRAVALILMASGSYTLVRQHMGVIASVVLGVVLGLAQWYALDLAIALVAFPQT